MVAWDWSACSGCAVLLYGEPAPRDHPPRTDDAPEPTVLAPVTRRHPRPLAIRERDGRLGDVRRPDRLAPGLQRPERAEQLRRPQLHDRHRRAALLHPPGAVLPGRLRPLGPGRHRPAVHRGAARPARPPIPGRRPGRRLHGPPGLPAAGPRQGRQPRPADQRGRQDLHHHDPLVPDPDPQRHDHRPGLRRRPVVDQPPALLRLDRLRRRRLGADASCWGTTSSA